MSVIRLRRKSHFVAVTNDTARSASLSLQAKGLLMVMLSYPDDWDFNLSHIEGNSRNGRDAHRTALRELIRAGYAAWRTVHDESGRLAGRELVISDEPTLRQPEKPSDGATVGRENRRTGNPTVGKSDTTKTESYEEPPDEELSPPHPPTREPDPKTEIEDDDFDPQALKRLQQTDRQLHKKVEMRAGSLGWQFRHKVLLAMRALADPDRTLAALQATIEGADGKGAKAWRYFAACYENHGQAKPNPANDVDDLLKRYMHAEGIHDGEPFTVIAAAPDGKTLMTDGAGYLTPQQVEEGMRCART